MTIFAIFVAGLFIGFVLGFVSFPAAALYQVRQELDRSQPCTMPV